MTTKATGTVKAESISAEAVVALNVAHSTEIKRIGEQIIKQVGEVGKSYLELCLYIRKHKLAPKLVSHELIAQGFHKVTVSKINRVANAGEELFKRYEAKMIGFKGVLELSRIEKPGEKAKPTPAGLLLTDTKAIDEKEQFADTEPKTEGGTKSKTSVADRMKNAAKYLALSASRDKTYTFPDCRYKVTVEKIPVTKPSLG